MLPKSRAKCDPQGLAPEHICDWVLPCVPDCEGSVALPVNSCSWTPNSFSPVSTSESVCISSRGSTASGVCSSFPFSASISEPGTSVGTCSYCLLCLRPDLNFIIACTTVMTVVLAFSGIVFRTALRSTGRCTMFAFVKSSGCSLLNPSMYSRGSSCAMTRHEILRHPVISKNTQRQSRASPPRNAMITIICALITASLKENRRIASMKAMAL